MSQQSLRAMVQVTSVLPLAPQSMAPLLQGQTQVNADPVGVINITDMSLLAVPGKYNLTVTLPDFPQVIERPLLALSPLAFKLCHCL